MKAELRTRCLENFKQEQNKRIADNTNTRNKKLD